MFKNYEALLTNWISGNTSLNNKRLGALSRDMPDVKESPQFTEDEIDKKANAFNQQIKKLRQI